jgi:hypothetical protein
MSGFGDTLVPVKGFTAPTGATLTGANRSLPPFGHKGAWQPFSTAQTYVFDGRLPNANGYTFRVLAGYAAPKITAGLGSKVNIIDRPLELGFTVPVGYDPFAMDVPIQFEALTDAWTGFPAITDDLEYDIEKLDWMAGRGRLYGDAQGHSTAGPAAGAPPLVTVASLDGGGNETNLIPTTLHRVDWMITNIAYDDTLPAQSGGGTQVSGGVIRDESGDRVRQAATVSLVQFIAAPGSDLSPANRQAARGAATGFQSFTSKQGLNTIYKIVMYVTGGSATYKDIQAVVAFNRGRLKITRANQPLKNGTKVEIPKSVLIQR